MYTVNSGASYQARVIRQQKRKSRIVKSTWLTQKKAGQEGKKGVENKRTNRKHMGGW